ncbi:tRNA adenosine(34) deaminase TadA [Pelosinus sp. sgz500959]|uniref:tRNA adenosine(34) deaminase TadA n=1 Tax=Pelosinus sp. sgz500959 TaxID=3242472 RepID=UPI00366B58D2
MIDDSYYMGLALEEARKAYDLGEIPIGAILVMDEQVIARGHNMREIWHDATAHAEMIVIRESCEKLKRWRLTGATLYVTIEPCPMCAGALVMSRIDRLVYGSSDYKAGAVESLFNIVQNDALNHSMVVASGVRSDECAEIMRDFFRSRRKNKKTLQAINNK